MEIDSLLNAQKEALFENVDRHFQAIELCLQHHCRMPALMLIYAGIDIFASLARPKDMKSATKKDYIEWCEKYILPNENISCSGIDLYAARCGVVHTYTAESSLSNEGKANQIAYAWGNRPPEALQKVIDRVDFAARVIHIETFAQAFRDGALGFLSELADDQERAALVFNRAGNLFKDQKNEL